MRRAFDYNAFVQGWRALAAAHDLEPRTGRPLEHAGRPWWAEPDLWAEPGPARSRVEHDAFANLAAEARALTHAAPEPIPALIDLVREVAAELRAERAIVPLRELHQQRGETVETIEGMRLLVPLRPKVA